MVAMEPETATQRIEKACSHHNDLHFRQLLLLGGCHAAQFVYSPHGTYEKYFMSNHYKSLQDLVEQIEETLGDDTMANIFKMTGDLFKYMTGEMIPEGKDVVMTVKEVFVDELQNQRGKEEKVVIHFAESKKGFVLGNKTNVRQMVKLFGAETDDWIGARVALYRADIQAFGKTQPVVRIRDYHPQSTQKTVELETGEIVEPQTAESLPFDLPKEETGAYAE